MHKGCPFLILYSDRLRLHHHIGINLTNLLDEKLFAARRYEQGLLTEMNLQAINRGCRSRQQVVGGLNQSDLADVEDFVIKQRLHAEFMPFDGIGDAKEGLGDEPLQKEEKQEDGEFEIVDEEGDKAPYERAVAQQDE